MNISQTVKVIKTRVVYHRGIKRVKLEFEYNAGLIEKVKKIEGVRWSATMRCWHIPYKKNFLEIINKVTGDRAKLIPNNHEEFRYNKKYPLNIHAKLAINKKEGVIYIKMPYNVNWYHMVKKMEGAWWHEGAKKWSVYYNEKNLNDLLDFFKKERYSYTISEFKNTNSDKRKFKEPAPRKIIPKEYFIQLKLENKSNRTIEVYSGFIAQFLNYMKSNNIGKIDSEKIREYILNDRENNGYSESYQRQMISAIKSFYKIVYNRMFESDELPNPKRSRYLPKILPREDIQKMIDVCTNQKHKIILLMLYGFGLRVSELVHLKLAHIDFERRQLIVIKGKGSKDRVLPIPKMMIEEIKKYIKSYLPGDYFLMGRDGLKYTSSSIQKVIRNISVKAGIKQRITPHMIRHCYATHMLENGTDLRYIQNLLGHKSSKTTEIYTHVTMHKLNKLSNPLDTIDF